MSNVDLFSTCATRTLLKLGCRQCLRRKECITFKFKHNGVSPYEFKHNGVSPYEYKQSLKEEVDNEETK